MKKILIGLIAGIILTTGVFAELSVLINPYPILFNGQPAEVEAYNINGRTFLALGDVAKYFNATATLNETTKQIEINSIKNTVMSSPKQSVAKIEIDSATKKPIGAEFIEYKGYKEAVQYNGSIYFPGAKIYELGISSKKLLGYETRFSKNGKEVTLDTRTPDSIIFVDSSLYYNVSIFKDILEE
jgi:hypothetical protein